MSHTSVRSFLSFFHGFSIPTFSSSHVWLVIVSVAHGNTLANAERWNNRRQSKECIFPQLTAASWRCPPLTGRRRSATPRGIEKAVVHSSIPWYLEMRSKPRVCQLQCKWYKEKELSEIYKGNSEVYNPSSRPTIKAVLPHTATARPVSKRWVTSKSK